MNIDAVIDQMQYQDKIDAEDKEIQQELKYHKQNWLDAVLKSPEESQMTRQKKWLTIPEGEVVRVYRNSADILLDEILNGNEEELAFLLIKLCKERAIPELDEFIIKLANEYAEREVEEL
jgi:hypothetical protein